MAALERVALLANPDSGSGEAQAVERMLRERVGDVVRFGLDQAEETADAEVQRIVVAGGDGSLGRGAAAAARAAVPLAVIPVGTANDFARALELPDDRAEAVALAVEGRRTRALDLARIDGRPFVNSASAGLSPLAARKADGLKAVLGPFAYALGALRAGVSAQPVRCRVSCDGSELFGGRAWQLTVACTGAFGGGSEVEADPHDGILDVVVIEAGARLRLIAHAYGMRAGRIEGQHGVVAGGGREIEVETDGATGFNVDGELIEAERPRLTIDPHAFEVVVS